MIPPEYVQRRRQSGIAIILVLSILVLLTAVVIAFFTNATTDLTASKGYSGEVQVKLLANAAVNVVEGQIRAATAGTDGNGKSLAWASQPGAVRTYDTTGSPVAAYKLYSSDEMVVKTNDPDGEFPFSPGTTATMTNDVPNNWNQLPSDFVDLNSPAVFPDPNGNLTDSTGAKYSARFPIIDGNNLAKGVVPNNPSALSYDSDNNRTADVDGFYVQPPATYNPALANTFTPSNAAYGNIAPADNPVPMPVRWLYVLQNGELHARVPGGAAGASGTIPDASKANPVVGRIAFWTDDDTCKLNVNTASEGTAWDPPRAKTTTDVKNALYIPGQNEFQMFPGHPAKTCLSTVFGSKWPIPTAGIVNTTNDYQKLLPYYDLVPRVTSGLFNSATNSQGSAGAIQVPTPTGIIYDADRLYASIDELMFNALTLTGGPPAVRPTRNVPSNIPGGVGATGVIDPAFLETTRFFLTASNRAPEVTLFNTPRLSLWPIQVQQSAWTGKDALLAFCTTIPTTSLNTANPYYYYFQRLNVGENNQFTTNVSCLNPTSDYASSTASGRRNQALYTYLQNLTSQSVPGLGGTFAAKYAPGAYQQLLTEMFDQIRSGVNTTGSTTGTNTSHSYTTYGEGYGEIVPLQPPLGTPGFGTQGFGRMPTITEAAIDLFVINSNAPAASKSSIQLGAVLILQPFDASPGYPNFSPEYEVEVSGLGGFTIAQSGADTPRSLGFVANDDFNIVDGGQTTGSATEFNALSRMFTSYSSGAKQLLPGGAANDTHYPFFNTPDPAVTASSPAGTALGKGNLPNGTKFFDLNRNISVPLTITIWPAQGSPLQRGPQPLQTFVLNFPQALNLPLPASTVSGTTASIFQGRITASDGNFSDQCDVFNGSGSAIINQADVVRSVIVDPKGPSKGDLRVIAALHTLNLNPFTQTSYFAPHPFYDNYNTSTTPKSLPVVDPGNAAQDSALNWHFAESLRTGENPGYGELGFNQYAGNSQAYLTSYAANSPLPLRRPAYAGPLACGLPTSTVPLYGPEAAPAVPVGTNGAYLADGTTPGDWDNGLGIVEDGPYINKPDEGNNRVYNTLSYAQAHQDTSSYFNRGFVAGAETGATFSPNREISSGVLFGSLPTGIDYTGNTAIQPWQTLLFCAYPPAFATTGDSTKHPGFGTTLNGTFSTLGLPVPPYKTAPDNVILDFFTMPIVEPYAISEPLSTQGKVNMNYQIAPFTYITRETAVQAVLKGTKMMAIPSSTTALSSYKTDASPNSIQYRYSINPRDDTGTLAAFQERFNGTGPAPADIFRSASEICTVPLVPLPDTGQTYDTTVPAASYSATAMQRFWNSCKLTGDNLREEPYGDLYARLTTKSNTFTVHVRVQTVKKSAGSSPTTFIDPADPTPSVKDVVTGEYRGSYQVERYVDPNVSTTGANAFPDYATAGLNATPISTFYKFHTIGAKQF